MKTRTQFEIERQIKGLERMKANMPEYSLFGDNNHRRVNIQLSILKRERPYSYYSSDEPDIESAAYDASEWIKGNSDDDLFDSEDDES